MDLLYYSHTPVHILNVLDAHIANPSLRWLDGLIASPATPFDASGGQATASSLCCAYPPRFCNLRTPQYKRVCGPRMEHRLIWRDFPIPVLLNTRYGVTCTCGLFNSACEKSTSRPVLAGLASLRSFFEVLCRYSKHGRMHLCFPCTTYALYILPSHS
jgi:hypothetical protein